MQEETKQCLIISFFISFTVCFLIGAIAFCSYQVQNTERTAIESGYIQSYNERGFKIWVKDVK